MTKQSDKKTKNYWLYDNLLFFKTNLTFNNVQDYIQALGISEGTYNTCKRKEPPQALSVIYKSICEILRKSDNTYLKNLFLDKFAPTNLVHENLEARTLCEAKSERQDLFPNKFPGIYLCYYTTTNSINKEMHYGILYIQNGEEGTDQLPCKAIFSISEKSEALEHFNKLTQHCNISIDNYFEKLQATYSSRYFEGTLFLSNLFFWLDMQAKDHSEFVSISFDFDMKVFANNPLKLFSGSRGLALSQSSGITNHALAFPLIICSHNIEFSDNDIKNYLSLYYNSCEEKEIEKCANYILNYKNFSFDSTYTEQTYITSILRQFFESHNKRVIFSSTFLNPLTSKECYDRLIKIQEKG